MKDLLFKGRFEGLDIAFTYAVTTRGVNEAVVRHNCDPAAVMAEDSSTNKLWKSKLWGILFM